MRPALPALLLASACNSLLGIPEPSHDPDAAVTDAGSAVDGSDPNLVTGIARTIHILESSEEIVPAPLSSPANIEAWIPDPTEPTGFRVAPGTVQDGSFTIESVLNGIEYYLRYQPDDQATPLFLVTRARVLDMTAYSSKRPDVAPASLSTTSVTFDVLNMSPWQPTGFFEIWSWNAGAYVWTSPEMPSHPRDGDVALSGFTVDWFQPFAGADPLGLLDASAGDRIEVAHMTPAKTSTGLAYQRMSQLFSSGPVDVNDGSSTPVSGDFTNVQMDQSLVVEFLRSQFLAYYWALGREYAWPPQDWDNWVFVDTLPWGKALDHGYYSSGAPDLVAVSEIPWGWGDVNVGEVVYGDPFSNGARQFVGAGIQARRLYSVPAVASGINRLSARMQVLLPLDEAGVAVAPLVSPVEIIGLTGMNYHDGGFFVHSASTDPLMMTWEPPVLGPPDYYKLQIFRYYAEGAALRRTPVATFYTRKPELILARSLFEPDTHYVMVLTAIAAPNSDVERRPFSPGFPYGIAEVMSGVFRVAP